MQAVERVSVQRYLATGLRFPYAVVARRAFRIVNDSASHIIVRRAAAMAARVLGPGPTRLKLVKLAHNLGNTGTVVELPLGDHDGATASQPSRRAA
jgi:urease accessory protein UreE